MNVLSKSVARASYRGASSFKNTVLYQFKIDKNEILHRAILAKLSPVPLTSIIFRIYE